VGIHDPPRHPPAITQEHFVQRPVRGLCQEGRQRLSRLSLDVPRNPAFKTWWSGRRTGGNWRCKASVRLSSDGKGVVRNARKPRLRCRCFASNSPIDFGALSRRPSPLPPSNRGQAEACSQDKVVWSTPPTPFGTARRICVCPYALCRERTPQGIRPNVFMHRTRPKVCASEDQIVRATKDRPTGS